MDEMQRRYYNVTSSWRSWNYRGEKCELLEISQLQIPSDESDFIDPDHVYPEHDYFYLKECLENLGLKGVELVNGESIAHMLFMLAVKYGI